jgi:hypothetical protein
LATYSANIKVNVTGLPSLQRLEDRVALLHKNFTKINAAAANITAPFQNHIRALEQMNRLLVANGRLLDQQANAANRLGRNTAGGSGQINGGNPRVLEEQRRGWQQQIVLLQQRARLLTDNAQITDKLRSATNNLIAGSQATVRLGLEQLKNAKALLTAAEDLAKTEALNFEHQLELISEVEQEEEQNARNTARRIKQEQDDRNALLRQRMTALQQIERQEQKAAQLQDKAFFGGAKKGGSRIADALTFGNGSKVVNGAMNSAVRGGIGAAVLAEATSRVTAPDTFGLMRGLGIAGPSGQGVSGLLGGIQKAGSFLGLPGARELDAVTQAVNSLLSSLAHMPGALQLATVAAFAFAPAIGGIATQAVVKGVPAMGRLGKAIADVTGIGKVAKPVLEGVKNVFDKGGQSLMEPLTNAFGQMNMELKTTTQLVNVLGATLEENLAASKVSRLASEFREFSAGIDESIGIDKAKRRNLDKRMRGYNVAPFEPGTDAARSMALPAYQERGLQQLSGGNINEVVGRMRTAAGQLSAVIEPMTTQVTAMSLSMKPLSDNTLEVVGALRQLGIVLENAIPIAQAEDEAIAKLSKDTAEFTARTNAAASAAARLSSEFYRMRRIQKLNSSKSPDGGFPVAGPMESPGFKSTKKEVGAFGENLALGAGFPLLFGAGPGSIAGSVAGSFMGSGFGGQILGGALGAVLDTAVVAVQKLGNAFVLAGDSYASLREQGVFFTAELEKQVNLAKAQGNFAKAQELQKSALTAQTGDVGGLATTGATAAVNELQKAWNGVTKAAGTTLAIVGAPLLFAINAVLRAVQATFALINLAVTGFANLINLIPGAKQLGAQLGEQAQKGTVEYENQVAELDKQITSNSKNLELLRLKDRLLSRSLTSSKAEQAITDKRIAAAERLSAFEEELRKLRESAPIGTAELRNKLGQQEFQLRQKFNLEEKAIALSDAREIYSAVIENNRNIKNQQRANELEYRDMVLQGLRAQQDLNLEVLRRVQDAKMRMREQELQYEQKLTAEQIKRQQLDNRQQTLQGSVDSVLSSDPDRASIINSVRTAISEWRTGRMSVEAEAAQKQQEIQLNFQKAQTAIERYKYDNAIRIARANEDSQNRIARINEGINKQNDEVSKMQYTRALGAVRLGLIQQGMQQERLIEEADFYLQLKQRGVPGSETIDSDSLNRQKQQARSMADLLATQLSDIERRFGGLAVSKLTPMAKVPGMANTSAPASAAETAANLQLRQNEQSIAQLQKINGLKENDLKLAEQLLKPNSELINQYNAIIKQQKDKAAFEREYGNLIRTGTLPEIAKELTELKIAKDLTEATYNTLIDTLTALPEFTKNPALQDIVAKLGTLKNGLNSKAAEASGAIIEGASPRNRLQNKADEVAGQLNTLQDPVNQIINMAGLLGQSFDDTFSAITKGTITAKEAFAQLTQSMAANFMKMATDMITKWIEMKIIGLAMNFFPGGGLLASGGKSFDMGGLNNVGMGTFNARNSFANLGMRAAGGPVSGGSPYIVGEKGPELFVPGRSGSIVPNHALGGGGTTNVVVNVDASGNSNVQGDQQQAKQLGVAVSATIQAELIKHQRPGGLLAGTRR